MRSPSPCPASDRLRALLDGVPPEPEQAELAQHLDDCEACQRALERLAAGDASFDETARRLAEADRSAGSDDPWILRDLEAWLRAPDEEPTGDCFGDHAPEAERSAWLGFLGPAPRPGLLGTLAQYEVR